MKTFRMSKLVRDKLPGLFAADGQKTTGRTLARTELKTALIDKIVEEAREIPAEDKVSDDIVAEIDDVQQALDDLKAEYGISDATIARAQAKKLAKKGGFRAGTYIETVSVPDSDKKFIKYYRETKNFTETTDTAPSVKQTVKLSEILAELGKIDRVTRLPGGRAESDAHHSFALAVIAWDFAVKYCPGLDSEKLLKYALVHDLLEIETGDVNTLLLSSQELHHKHNQEKSALKALKKRLAVYPELLKQLADYERLDTPEAATIFVLDKACTTWTHFHDQGANLRSLGIHDRQTIDDWYARLLVKIEHRLQCAPPPETMMLLKQSFMAMRKELFKS